MGEAESVSQQEGSTCHGPRLAGKWETAVRSELIAHLDCRLCSRRGGVRRFSYLARVIIWSQLFGHNWCFFFFKKNFASLTSDFLSSQDHEYVVLVDRVNYVIFV